LKIYLIFVRDQTNENDSGEGYHEAGIFFFVEVMGRIIIAQNNHLLTKIKVTIVISILCV
jgi:hypothetical protein